MNKAIYLKLNVLNKVITIPFLGIYEVDEFTVMFKNKNELVKSLKRILKLSINVSDVENVYLSFDRYKMNMDSSCYSIKYAGDNFNYESLRESFASYLKDDPTRIYKTDIRYVRTPAILDYLNEGVIDSLGIDNAVRVFLGNGTGYKRKRDTYFLIKDFKKIAIDKVELEPLSKVDRTNLASYGTGGDDYLNYLIELSTRSEEDFERAMDELGQTDLEDLKKHLIHGRYGVTDGVGCGNQRWEQEVFALEMGTGLSISNLCGNIRTYRHRR